MSTLDWLRNNQTSSGRIGRVSGPERVPDVRGFMYTSQYETEGATMTTDMLEFDAKMNLFKSNRGPPPAPLRSVDYGEPEVHAYARWWSTTGSALAAKWQKEHPSQIITPKRPIQKSPSPPPAPKKEAPSRIILEVSDNSGW
jgi:hypothetical protein